LANWAITSKNAVAESADVQHVVAAGVGRLRRAVRLQSMQTSFARGLRALKIDHCSIVAVPRPWVLSTHDSLSETKTTSSPIALRRLR